MSAIKNGDLTNNAESDIIGDIEECWNGKHVTSHAV